MSKRFRAGVLHGEEVSELLRYANENDFALPAVNVIGTNSVNSVLETARELNSPVIVQFSNGGASFYAGKALSNDGQQSAILGGVSGAMHVHQLAEAYGVPVILHTDHAAKKLLPWIDGLLEHGERFYEKNGQPLYSSHMLDLSEEPMEFNLSECARILSRMAPLNMSLEIELGVTGGEEDGIGHGEHDASADNSHLYTQPEDVLQAYERLAPIGHFSVAASFGNVHGVYKPGNVQLRPEILKNSQELIEKERKTGAKPLNLVFHGGSGSEKEKITEAVGYGVFKMNIDTDLQFAYSEAIGKFVTENPKAFLYQVDPETDKPYKKFYDPRKYLRAAELNMVARLDEAFADLGSKGKSLCL